MSATRKISVPLAEHTHPANLDGIIGQQYLVDDEVQRINKAVKHFVDQILTKRMVQIFEFPHVSTGRNHA